MPKVSADKAQNSAHRSEQESTNRRKYFFQNVDDLAVYFYKVYPLITPIKLQKGLYFLYAYYSGTFACFNASHLFDDYAEFGKADFYPEHLFKPEFVAWKLGPVILSVHEKYLSGYYKEKAKALNVDALFETDTALGLEVKLFVDDFFLNRICQLNDFALVDRSHTDQAWLKAWGDGSVAGKPMDPALIQEEYIKINRTNGTLYG